MILFGILTTLLLSSCATRQDLADVQRQLQTTRAELATVRKGTVELRALADELLKTSASQQGEFSRLNEQMKMILSTIEVQQKAIASSNSFMKQNLAAMERKDEERLKKLEERIGGQEKGVLTSQGNLGTRIEELTADLKIIQGKLEENNNLLAEHGIKLDELGQSGSRSGGKAEKAEANLKALQEAQSSSAERLGRTEEQVRALVKSWEGWREMADRTLTQAAGLERRLGVVEAELVRVKEAQGRSGTGLSVSDSRRSKPESGSELIPPLKEKEKSGAAEYPATAGLPGGEEIYKAALDDYARGDYDLAISGFRSYVAKYPRGTLAANSQYWLGECYYSQKKLEQSIIEFDTVSKQYPSSEKARSALLKKGYAYLASGNVAKGKSALREVMEKYPGTQEASLAESRMANLK